MSLHETWFAPVDIDSAPEAAKAMLAASEKQFGFLPNPVAKAAHSPELLRHLFAGFAAFDRTTLSHVEREIVAMTVGYEVGCHYCMALHSTIGASNEAVAPHVAALREGGSLGDPKLETLRIFAREVFRAHGNVEPAIRQRFAAAGYSAQAALDVVLGVSVYVLSTFTNVFTDAQLDPAFAAFAWRK